jgi:hypothetical protein
MGKRDHQPSIPVVLAFLLCDKIVQEAGTGKKTIVGIFDRVWAESFPTVHGPFGIYAKLADAAGAYDLKIDILHLESNEMIGQGGMKALAGDDPLAVVDLVLNLPGIPLPKQGTYEFQLSANGVWIGRTKLIAARKKKGISK